MIRTRWALATLLATCLLGACSDGDPKPDIADPTSSASASSSSATVSTSATTEPTDGAPGLPAAATQQDDQGAEAFARYWVELVNYAQSSGDTRALRDASDSRCDSCGAIASAIEGPYATGGHIEGGALSIGKLKKLPLDHDADWAGFAKGKVAAQSIFSGSGPPQTSNGGPFYFYAYAAWVEDRWSMRWLRTQSPS